MAIDIRTNIITKCSVLFQTNPIYTILTKWALCSHLTQTHGTGPVLTQSWIMHNPLGGQKKPFILYFYKNVSQDILSSSNIKTKASPFLLLIRYRLLWGCFKWLFGTFGVLTVTFGNSSKTSKKKWAFRLQIHIKRVSITFVKVDIKSASEISIQLKKIP